MSHCAFHQGFCCGRAVFCQNFFFQRTGIDTDPNGNAAFLTGFHYCPYPIHAADVSGVNPYLIDSSSSRFQCKPIVKMNIRYQRNMNSLLDCRNQRNCIAIWNRGTNDFASGLFQYGRLRCAAFNIIGTRVQHRLDIDMFAV